MGSKELHSQSAFLVADHAERNNRTRGIVSSFASKAASNLLPIDLMITGSVLYKPDTVSIHDIDLFLFASPVNLSSSGFVNYIFRSLGIDIVTDDEDMKLFDHLISGKANTVGYETRMADVPMSIRIMTPSSLRECISPIGYHPRVAIGKDIPSTNWSPQPVFSVTGDRIMMMPAIIKRDTTTEYYFVERPGSLKKDVPTVPFLYGMLLPGKVIYEGTNSGVGDIIENTVWKNLVRAILYYNNLYGENGQPLPQAYNYQYIANLLIRRDHFSAEFADFIYTKYTSQLSRISLQSQSRLPCA